MTANANDLPVPIARKRRLGRILERSRKCIRGYYKGHLIEIDLEPGRGDIPGMKFYIIVTAPCGMKDYDGWWGDANNTIDEALQEAFRGAML